MKFGLLVTRNSGPIMGEDFEQLGSVMGSSVALTATLPVVLEWVPRYLGI